MTKERPVLFSAPMVRAILAGVKTQTRRALRIQPPPNTGQVSTWHHPGRRPMFFAWVPTPNGDGGAEISDWKPQPCPYGQPGDRLWVREAFAIVPRTAYRCSEGVQQTLRPDDDHDAAIYREGWTRSRGGFSWRPSIHMPRWASRITLEITGVRVERLQDISEVDSIDEGVLSMGQQWEVDTFADYFEASGVAVSNGEKPPLGPSPRKRYAKLWEQINGPGSWDANPWVWVVSFTRVAQAA